MHAVTLACLSGLRCPPLPLPLLQKAGMAAGGAGTAAAGLTRLVSLDWKVRACWKCVDDCALTRSAAVWGHRSDGRSRCGG